MHRRRSGDGRRAPSSALSRPWSGVLFAALAVVAVACGARGHKEATPLPEDPKFVDFTAPAISSLAEFRQLAAVPAGPADDRPSVYGVKFVIAEFSDPSRRKLKFLDSRYYQFHDQWFWFRMINGQPVPGGDRLDPMPFATPDAAQRWALEHEMDLPHGLDIRDGRLYAEVGSPGTELEFAL